MRPCTLLFASKFRSEFWQLLENNEGRALAFVSALVMRPYREQFLKDHFNDFIKSLVQVALKVRITLF